MAQGGPTLLGKVCAWVACSPCNPWGLGKHKKMGQFSSYPLGTGENAL